MNARNGLLISVAANVVAGVIIAALLLYRGETSKTADTSPVQQAPIADSVADIPVKQSVLEQPAIAHPGIKMSSQQRAQASLPRSEGKILPSLVNTGSLDDVRVNRAILDKLQLLKAGYPPERAEWLTQRSSELWLERDRMDEERRQQKLPVDKMLMVYAVDKDLDLANEIGDEEYTRYRQATGRQVSAPIDGMQPGSNAEIAGLQKDDEVISYAGKRIYNYNQLVLLSNQTSGQPVQIEVNRNGQNVVLVAQAGTLGLKPLSAGKLLRVIPVP